MARPMKVDGSTLEGGGQLIRLFILLSALTGKPLSIKNIRAGRPGGGGLKGQHLAALQWLSKLCDAEVEGAVLRSRELLFEPSLSTAASRKSVPPLFRPAALPDGTAAQRTSIAMESAGAVSLVLQAVLPFLLFSPLVPRTPLLLTLHGGTNVSMSPSIDYVLEVFAPTLQALFKLDQPLISIAEPKERQLKRGWTHGGSSIGEVTLLLRPVPAGMKLSPFSLSSTSRGDLVGLKAVILAPTPRVCAGIAARLRLWTSRAFKTEVELDIVTQEPTGNPKRYYLLIAACMSSGVRLGADWMYDRKIGSDAGAEDMVADALVKRVGRELQNTLDSGRCVDLHCEDQLVVFQALAYGRSVGCGDGNGKATLHTETARWAVERMLGVEFDDQGSCEGVGFASGVTSVDGTVQQIAGQLDERLHVRDGDAGG